MKIFVIAKPNAHKNSYSVVDFQTLKVSITAAPVDGKANEAIREYLAEIFSVSKSKVKLLKGSTSKQKTFEVEADESDLKKIFNFIF